MLPSAPPFTDGGRGFVSGSLCMVIRGRSLVRRAEEKRAGRGLTAPRSPEGPSPSPARNLISTVCFCEYYTIYSPFRKGIFFFLSAEKTVKNPKRCAIINLCILGHFQGTADHIPFPLPSRRRFFGFTGQKLPPPSRRGAPAPVPSDPENAKEAPDMSTKEEFIEIYRENIHRDGAEALLDFLENKSDFFTAPASALYHGAYAGGLCDHSLNVYHCLVDYLDRERVTDLYGLEYSPESVALVSLLHDVCKIGCYRPSTRNVKGPDGKWQQVPSFSYDDPLPYGHGEKSVYVVNGFLRLTREEAMAIRWHMGFSGTEDNRLVGRAFVKYPLAFALSVADMEATYFLEEESAT